MILDRRAMLAGAGGMLVAGCSRQPGAEAGRSAADIVLPFANGERPLVAYPGKRPLIRLAARPPQLETPFPVFGKGLITPNDAFFVRYHLADIPLEIDSEAWRLKIGGHVGSVLSLSLADLKALGTTELVAVNQCSGNSRGFSEPRVGGGQLGHGAMGCARWQGVPLRVVLERASVRAGARQVTFNGLDNPVAPGTPDFVKALDIDHALDGEVMLAWGMNGEDLPFLNGYPLRLVVPGWFGTYWVKHLSEIMVVDKHYDGYWMKTAYRIPDNECACVPAGAKPGATMPISRFAIRSFITSHAEGDRVVANRSVELGGFAFDSGSGIARVMISTDGGHSWTGAVLDEEPGRYGFRGWRLRAVLPPGDHVVMAQAMSRSGEVQPMQARWNPAGYLRNVVEQVKVRAG